MLQEINKKTFKVVKSPKGEIHFRASPPMYHRTAYFCQTQGFESSEIKSKHL